MEHLVDLYLEELKGIRDPKTVGFKEGRLKHFVERYDHLLDMDRRELLDFYRYLRGKGLKESTIRATLEEVRRFYRWLSQRGYSVEFDSEALADIYRAKRKQEESRRRKKYYSDDELNLILKAIRGEVEGVDAKHPVYYLLVTFLVSSGLRLSEALSVKKKDIKIKKVLTEEGEEKEVWKVKVKEGKFGKEREALIYFFRPEWGILWEKWLEKLKPEDYVFTYTIKYPKSTKTLVLKTDTAKRFFWELEKKIREKGYELEVNAHRFRNTYIIYNEVSYLRVSCKPDSGVGGTLSYLHDDGRVYASREGEGNGGDTGEALMRKVVRSAFFLFFGLGLLLIVADEVWKRKNVEKFDYLDVKIWTEGDYVSGSLRGKEKERAQEMIEELAESGKAVWFGAPRFLECPVEIWDAWKEEFYRVCKGKYGRWYVQLPGSYQGRGAERYFEVKEEEARKAIKKLEEMFR